MGKLNLHLKNIYGETLNEATYVSLAAQRSTEVLRARIPHGNAAIEAPDGVYQMMVDPPSYLPAQVFTRVPAELELICVMQASKVAWADTPVFDGIDEQTKLLLLNSHRALGFPKPGEALYNATDSIRRAGLLNIAAKASATILLNGRSVWSYPTELLELRGERCFVAVPHELREEIKNAAVDDLFDEVSGALHHPPEGFALVDSYKTKDNYGNLQVTFFVQGSEWRADIDIDDAAGIGHVFQVVRNKVGRRHTHPYDIHQLLWKHQQLDTGYRLVLNK